MDQKPTPEQRIIRITPEDVQNWRTRFANDEMPVEAGEILCAFGEALLIDLNSPPGAEPRIRRVDGALEIHVPLKLP